MSLKANERGTINGLLLPLIIAILLLFGVAAFGFWAYSGRQDYKDNVDEKIAVAVKAAKVEEGKAKDAQFAEERKSPFRTYIGPSAYGSLIIKYPNTWSGYVPEATGSPYVDGYFAPGVVPDTDAEASTFALRFDISSQSYSETLQRYQGASKNGTATVRPYALPKVPSVVGSYVSGELEDGKRGHMVILPLRNTTLKIWTESDQYKADFDNIILPNASFSP